MSAQLYEAAGVSFSDATERATAVSEAALGIYHTGRQNRALMVFAKMIAHALSTAAILRVYEDGQVYSRLLDHFSIATLGRAIIDAALMAMYISEPRLSRDQWDLRRQLLFLHDHSNRKRFLTSMSGKEARNLGFFQNYEEMRASLQAKIRDLAEKLGYTRDVVEEMTKGQRVFVDGARSAAREAGWDVELFDFQQSYLSNWVHSHPVSFLRAEEHGLSFERPSDFQLGFTAVVLETNAAYLDAATERMTVFSGGMDKDPIGQLD